MRAEHNADGTADGAGHADQGIGRQPKVDRSPAETLTREEYADQIRVQTSPIAREETSRGAEAGNGRADAEDQDAGTAESRQFRPTSDQPSRPEPDASARAGPSAEESAVDDQAAGDQKRQEARPDQGDDSTRPESSPDATGNEPHWDDAWRLPDGRQVRVRMDGDRDWMHNGSAEIPPSGDELLSMEDEEASRPEKLRRKFFDAENVGDFLDAEKEGAQTVQDILSPPQHVGAHTLTPTVDISPVSPPHADAGDTLTGITVLAVLGAEAIRSAARHWRALERT